MILRIMHLVLSVLFWLVAGVLALMIISAPMFVVPVLGWVFGPVGGLLMLLIIARSARRVRRSRGSMVLNYLRQAVSLNLPIPPMLAAARRSESGMLADRLDATCAALEHGQPVGEALHANVPELPARSVDLISAGERIGRLPSVLERLTTEERAVSRSYSYSSLLGWNYGVVLLLFMMLVLTGIGAFIIPMFEEIFEDFDVALPWQTVKTFETIRHLGWPMLVLVTVVILAVTGWALQQSLHGIEGAARPLRAVTDRLIWLTPVARSVARDRGLGDACGLMAESLKAGDSLEAAAYEAGELKTNIIIRRRMQRFADALQSGKPLRNAAEQARLPKLMVGLLATGQAVSDPVRVFDFLARYYANRFSRTATLIQASILPTVVLSASLMVGWIVYSIMLPLVVLIEDATMKVGTF